MKFYTYEEIKLPLIYAQKVYYVDCINRAPLYKDIGEPVGPFLYSRDASAAVHPKVYTGVYGIMNQPKALLHFRFFTKGTKSFTFKNLNIRQAKEIGALISPLQLTKDVLESNLKICGYENVKLINFNGSLSLMEVKCSNVNCHEKVHLKYSHLTMPSYIGAKCESCRNVYQTHNRLGKLNKPKTGGKLK